MSKSTNNNQKDTLNSQANSENNLKQNSPLIEREEIKGTPFTLIKQDELYFIVMGDHRLTEPTELKNEQYLKLENEKWLILTNVIIIILDKMNKNAEEIRQQQLELETIPQQ